MIEQTLFFVVSAVHMCSPTRLKSLSLFRPGLLSFDRLSDTDHRTSHECGQMRMSHRRRLRRLSIQVGVVAVDDRPLDL